MKATSDVQNVEMRNVTRMAKARTNEIKEIIETLKSLGKLG